MLCSHTGFKNQQVMNIFAFCPISASPYLPASFSLTPSSLGLKEFIPIVASAASNALTSASDLRTTRVIRQDSYLLGSPTASVPLSFYPLSFLSRPLSSLSQHHFLSFWSSSPAVCSVCLFFFCLIITSELYNISFTTFHDSPAWIFSEATQNICTCHSTV